MARIAAQPAVPMGYQPCLIVPDGYSVKTVSKAPTPPLDDFIRARLTLDTPGAFCEYINTFKTETSLCFAALESDNKACFEAILDYHKRDRPCRAAHRVSFLPTFSAAHKAWLDLAVNPRSQEHFIEFLMQWGWTCDAMDDADILELVSNLEFKSVSNLFTKRSMNGTVALSYSEEVQGHAGSKMVELPSVFRVAFPIFEGMPNSNLAVNVIYKVQQGTLTMKFLIPHHSEIVRNELMRIIVEITKETKIPVLPGAYSG